MTPSAELSEAAWARIEPLMPQAEGRSRPGHATMAIALDTYSHVIPSMGEQTATAMEDALS